MPAHYGFSVRLRQVQCKQGRFLRYSLFGIVLPNMFEELEAKQNVVIHHDPVTHPLQIDK